jgi:hypothetical protein
MSKDRQKIGIFIVLLGVLAVTAYMSFRINDTPATAVVQASSTQAKPSTIASGATDARILLEVVKPGVGKENIGNKNLFQYQQAPPPVAPPRGIPALVVNVQPAPVQVPISAPPPPRPVPTIPLKYQGFASTNNGSQGMTAFLADDFRHYNVTVGEVLMGRYRIASISDKSVEVEDLDNNRRQSLPLVN